MSRLRAIPGEHADAEPIRWLRTFEEIVTARSGVINTTANARVKHSESARKPDRGPLPSLPRSVGILTDRRRARRAARYAMASCVARHRHHRPGKLWHAPRSRLPQRQAHESVSPHFCRAVKPGTSTSARRVSRFLAAQWIRAPGRLIGLTELRDKSAGDIAPIPDHSNRPRKSLPYAHTIAERPARS